MSQEGKKKKLPIDEPHVYLARLVASENYVELNE